MRILEDKRICKQVKNVLSAERNSLERKNIFTATKQTQMDLTQIASLVLEDTKTTIIKTGII